MSHGSTLLQAGIVSVPSVLPLAAASLFCPVVLAPGDWYVDINDPNCANGSGGPNDPFCDIATAIAAAADNDRIFIAPGSYFENLVIGKDLTLIGTGGQSVTVVDGSASGSVAQVLAGSTVTMEDLTLTHGSAVSGGGVANDGTFTALDCKVDQNTASFRGGGIFSSGALTLMNSTVSGNCAQSGLGIYAYGTTSLVDSTITGNDVLGLSDGGAVQAHGDLTVSSCEIHTNGGRGVTFVTGSLTMTNTTLRRNSAYYGDGGGLLNHSGTVSLVDCVIDSNRTAYGYDGGGISNRSNGTITLTNCTVSSNDGSWDGGGVANSGSMTLTNCTVAHNEAYFNQGGGISNKGTLTIDHTILAGNTSYYGYYADDCDGSTITSAGYNLISHTGTCMILGDPTGNLLNVDPRFTDPSGGDFTLQSTSPCVEAGDPARTPAGKDLGDNPRLLDGDLDRTMVVDMGAYEFNHTHLTLTGSVTPGGMVTVQLTGTQGLGLQGFLWVGSAEKEVAFAPFGALFVDVTTPPWFLLPLGSLPASLTGTIPANTPPGTPLVLQGLGVILATGTGNQSNVIAAVVE